MPGVVQVATVSSRNRGRARHLAVVRARRPGALYSVGEAQGSPYAKVVALLELLGEVPPARRKAALRALGLGLDREAERLCLALVQLYQAADALSLHPVDGRGL